MGAPQPGVILRVRDISKTFGRVAAVRDVTFSVRRAEVLGLIGPNGSGKTTLFQCLGGVLPFDGGSVEPAAGLPSPAVFYLPDAVTPWADQSVRWVLDFAAGYFGPGTAPRDEIIARLGLGPLFGQAMRTLSKGQRKRTLLAVGLLAPHPILLADEPFDGLDLRQTREVAALLRSVASSGRTMFLSIHQIADAERVCDRFVLLSAGRVCGEGTLDQLAARTPPGIDDGGQSLEDLFLALT